MKGETDMTDVTFKTGESEVTIKAEDLPKVAEKAEQFSKKVVELKKKAESETDTQKEIEKEAIAMARRVTISKIKIDKKFHAMTVNYSGSNNKRSKETTFTGYEEMIEKKYFKVQSLKEHVIEILRFPESWSDELVITGISFNYDDEVGEMRGMVVTLQKEIEDLNCPLNINTPFIKFERYISENSPYPANESTWNYEVSSLVDEILNITYLYMCGDTKAVQQKLAI